MDVRRFIDVTFAQQSNYALEKFFFIFALLKVSRGGIRGKNKVFLEGMKMLLNQSIFDLSVEVSQIEGKSLFYGLSSVQ